MSKENGGHSSIANFSVRHPVAVTMRIAALVLLGVVCLSRLPVDLLPKVSPPAVSVQTSWPNVAPEEIETQLTRPIEEAVSSSPGVYLISSSSRQGTSTVNVQFNWGTDVGQAAVDVLQRVERARQQFPNDPTLGTPAVAKADPSQLPILIYSVTGETDMVKLSTILENQIAPVLESADGVAAAVISGGQDRAILVDVDTARLRAYHQTFGNIVNRISQENISQPAGIAQQGRTEMTIRSVGYFKSPAEIARVPLGSYNGEYVTLGRVAQIRDSHQETRLYTRFNGTPAVGLLITEQSDANTVATAQSVAERIAQLQQRYPNLRFSLAYDQSQYIEDAIANVRDSALIGGGLAILILLFFLRNLRSTLVVALSIPISIISTFVLFYVGGFTINTISLSGLALATGLIVDDAVVVLENIFRHIERDGKSVREAAVTGTEEITSAVIASTLTVMVVFLPLFLIRGQAGQTFRQFALVVIFSIAVSLLDALTVVPMLASILIKEKPKTEPESNPAPQKNSPSTPASQENLTTAPSGKKDEGVLGNLLHAIDENYRDALRGALRRRWLVIVGAIVITLCSLLLMPAIGTELFPRSDTGNFNLKVKLPVGTALADTNSVMRQVEDTLRKNPEVESVFVAAGSDLSPQGTVAAEIPYQGAATVKLKANHRQTTDQVAAAVQKALSGLPGAQVTAQPYDLVSQLLTGDSSDVAVDIIGDDVAVLEPLSAQVMSALKKVPNLQGLDTNVEDATPELHWQIDRDRASQLGVNFSDVAGTLATATSGTLATYYQEGGYQYPIYVQLPEAKRKTIPELLALPITPGGISTGSSSATGSTTSPGTMSGSTTSSVSSSLQTSGSGVSAYGLSEDVPHDVLLGQVATPVIGTGPSEIARQERHRFIGVHGRAVGRAESDIEADVTKALSQVKFPTGYYWEFGMGQRQRKEEFAGLGVAVGLAVALIYMLLASQFESFIFPLVVLVCVPLAISGVLTALFLSGRAFGLTAFIGVLMLIGIVVKNGILLVEYTNQLRKGGMERQEAILTAAPTRLRPILMTASAAILGMLPLAMGIGRGSETQAPLATAVVGGLATSTLLTLFVVPAVYTLFDDLSEAIHKRFTPSRKPENSTAEESGEQIS